MHGGEGPHILTTNPLGENLADIQEKDRYDVVLANPPFGGKERAEVQQNFPIKTGETASLFLQHFIQEGVRWAHLDIAGVDWAAKPTPLCPAGPSAFGARTLLELARGGVQ